VQQKLKNLKKIKEDDDNKNEEEQNTEDN